ncbi:hypothetical protein [Alloyangia pacifica]|uniref:Uncharacterized protein n=1 Tax=Alloyangia pacifica TaxID=311180 RepID=A0A1I6PBK9_9RHOB|nr:hypothetical protein [Alloyangia pacifica]SDG23989.1 hypothetical protein SAMN04488245_102129 [Alloyangia pacifica]SFS37587.1 hypothetical protein SAMN04488050_101430 [Alloyangia pacifica]
MKRTTLIQLGALVALVVFGAYHGARAQQPIPTPAPACTEAEGGCAL